MIELAAAAMPVVGSTHCDIPGAVLDGETGFIVPERDADLLWKTDPENHDGADSAPE